MPSAGYGVAQKVVSVIYACAVVDYAERFGLRRAEHRRGACGPRRQGRLIRNRGGLRTRRLYVSARGSLAALSVVVLYERRRRNRAERGVPKGLFAGMRADLRAFQRHRIFQRTAGTAFPSWAQGRDLGAACAHPALVFSWRRSRTRRSLSSASPRLLPPFTELFSLLYASCG